MSQLKSIHFDGESAFVNSPLIINGDWNKPLTVSLWCKPETLTPPKQCLVDAYGSSGDAVNFRLYLSGDKVVLHHNSEAHTGAGSLSVDKWHHIAYVYSPTGWTDALSIYDPNLIGAYEYEESSGVIRNMVAGQDLVPNGTPGYRQFGKLGYGYRLNGSPSYLDLGTSFPVVSNFSFFTWLFREAAGTSQWIFNVGKTTSDSDPYLSFYIDGNGYIMVYLRGSTTTAIYTPYPNSITMLQGKWVHLGFSIKNNWCTIWMDGLKLAEGNLPDSVSSAIGPYANIGRHRSNSNYINGWIDSTYLWSEGLSEEAIYSLYNKGMGRSLLWGQGKLYVDGQLVETLQVPKGDPRPTSITLGRSSNADPSSFYKGNLEELYVWEKALPESELVQFSNRSAPAIYSVPNSYNNWVEKVGTYDNYLVGAWAFDDYDRKFDSYGNYMSPDLSGNFPTNLGYFLQTTNITQTVVSEFGKLGKSFYSNGDGSSRAYISGGPDLSNASFTISMWFYSRLYGDYQILVFNSTDNNRRFLIWLRYNYLYVVMNDNNWILGTNAWGPRSISQNQWHHMVFTYEYLGGSSNKVAFYVNGDADNWTTTSYTNPSVNGNTYFGSTPYNTEPFVGYMDQIYIWKTVPSNPTEFAKALYNKGSGLKAPRQKFSDRNPLITQNRKFLWPASLRVSDANLVGHWRMDNLEDSSTIYDDAKLHHGTKNGTVKPTQIRRLVRARWCCYFGGSAATDYVSVPDANDFDVSAMTISFWLQNDNWINTANIRFIDRMDTTGSGDGFYIERTGSGNSIYFALKLGATTYLVNGTTVLSDNNWHQVVATWSGTQMKVWIDGIKQSNSTVTPASAMSSTRGLNFARSGAASNPFIGRMGSIHFWNCLLSDAQIGDLYSNGVGPEYTPVYRQWPRELAVSDINLVSLWGLDEAIGTIRDSYAKNHGTASGSITYGASGLTDKAITLTATTQYVDFGNSSSLDLEKGLTLSVWLNKGSAWGTSGDEYDVVGKGSREENGYGLSVKETVSGPEVNFWIRNAGVLLRVTKLKTTGWGISSWVHIVGTFEGHNAFLYIDGYPEASGGIEELGSTSYSFRIGKNYSSGSLALLASIEDVAVWNQPLSVQQVNLLWNNGNSRTFPKGRKTKGWTGHLAASDADLRHYWKLNEREGETITDHMGNWSTTPSVEYSPSYRTPGIDGDYGMNFGSLSTSANWNANDSINLGTGPIEWISNTGLTVSIWHKVRENDRHQYVFMHRYYGHFIISSGMWPQFYLILANGSGYVVHSTQVPKGEWVHIVGTWKKNQNIALYINSELMACCEVPDYTLYDYRDYSNYIGRYISSGSNYYQTFGDLDEVMLWRSALNPEQVRDLYNDGKGRVYYNSSTRLRSYDLHLVSGWKFEEASGVRVDSIGENSLVETNGAIGSTTGKEGNSADFTGTSGLMVTSPVGFTKEEECYTVSCYIKVDSWPADWVDLWAIDTVGSTSYVALRVMSTGYLRHSESHGSEVYQASTAPLTLSTWYHVVATYDGSKLHLYLDNVEQGTGTAATPTYQPHRFVVGQSYGAASPVRYFDGTIDELYLWDTNLSTTSIDEVYRGGYGWFISSTGFSENLAYHHRDMVSAWKFEDSGSVKDSLGDGLGSPHGGITYQAAGKEGYALELDGVDGYVELDPEVSDNFSISCWISTTDTDNGAGKEWYGGKGILDGKKSTEGRDFGLSVVEGKLAFGTGSTTNVTPWGAGLNTLLSQRNINTGEWVHLVVTRDKRHGDKRIYMNGVLENESAASIATFDQVQKLVIGAMGDQRSGSFLNFRIDELYLWKYAISPSLIQDLYNGSRGRFYLKGSNSWAGLITASDASLRSVYHLSDLSTTIVDTIGTTNGTYNGDLNSQIGKYGTALGFDGVNDYISILDSFDPTAYTWSFWLKPLAWNIQVLRRPDTSHELYIDSNGRFVHYTYDGTGRTITGTTVVKLGRWYHVVMNAANSGTMKLYVDGIEEASWGTLGTLWTGGDRWYVGNGGAGSGTYFLGTLDEVYYWTTQLSALAVWDLFNKGTGKFYGA